MFNPVAPYQYLLPTVYLALTDIANPDLLACVNYLIVGPGLVSTSPVFMMSRASHPVGPHGQLALRNGKSGPSLRGLNKMLEICNEYAA